MAARALTSYVGIINQGSTCYLSSAIQALFHLPLFRRKLYNLRLGDEDKVARALRNIFAELDAGNDNIRTEELTSAFGWDNREAAVQHDVHEMVQQLFDKLEATVKGTEHETFIRDIFHGLTVYRSKAVDVDYTSDRLEGFYDAELVVKGKSDISESLKAFTEPERIEGVSLELKPGVKPTPHTIDRTQRFLELPPVLLVHPNRVTYDTETFELVTLTNRWTFSTELDLHDSMIDGGTLKLDKESKEKELKLKRGRNALPCSSSQYELRTIIIHAGDANIGHYYCYVRFGDEWVRFNDESVSTVSVAEVEKAAFGGQVAVPSRLRLFENERASLLVFVNKDMQDEVLVESTAPTAMLELARNIEASRTRALTTRTLRFAVCNKELEGLLDNQPNGLEQCSQEVEVQTSWSDAKVYEAIADKIGVSPELIRALDRSTYRVTNEYMRLSAYSVSHYKDIILVQVLKTPTSPLFVAFLRLLEDDDNTLGEMQILNSPQEVLEAVPRKWTLYSCGANRPAALVVSALDQICDGAILIASRRALPTEHIASVIEARQFLRTRVVFIDKMRCHYTPLFSLTISGTTSYQALQGGVYDALRQRHFASLPGSAKCIAFHKIEYHSQRPSRMPCGPVISYYEGGPEYDVTLDHLWGRGTDPTLYFSVLPKPLSLLNLKSVIHLNLGWGKQPLVYVDKNTTTVTLKELMEKAVDQLGEDFPAQLLRQYQSKNTAASRVVRLLQVSDGKLSGRVVNDSEPVDVASAKYVLSIDPVTSITNHDVVDVLFCDRRAGEEYFGIPTSIPVSVDMTEKAHEVMGRIIKKLGIPDAQKAEAAKKWMLSVKSGAPSSSSKIKTASAGDELRALVESVGGKPYMLLVDRPKMLELDGTEDSRKANSIVIKAASMADLSSL